MIPVLVIAALVAGAYGLSLWLTRARNRAGIPTSRVGRALRLGALSLGLGVRALPARVRRWLTPRAGRETLIRRQQEELAMRAAASMGSMKGVLMKLGQIVSFMDDALPEAVAQALRPLQKSAPPMPFEVVRAVIEEELGAPVEALFRVLDPEPIASASIGQVHRGELPSGAAVAVKVQYPGVADAIRSDLGNASMLAAVIGAVTPSLDARALARELEARMLEELDYQNEARNQQLFACLYERDPDIRVPAVIEALSAERVLVSELVSGLGFYEFCSAATAGARQRAALAIHRFVFDSLWFHNVFNADPHPGNFLFTSDGHVTCLDFGSVKRFPGAFLAGMRRMTRSYLAGDVQGFYDHARQLGFIRDGQEHRVSPEWLWDFVAWFHEPIAEDREFTFTPQYTRRAVGQVFGDNMRKVNMPPDYLLLNRITFGVNSLLTRLGASYNWHRLAQDHLREPG